MKIKYLWAFLFLTQSALSHDCGFYFLDTIFSSSTTPEHSLGFAKKVDIHGAVTWTQEASQSEDIVRVVSFQNLSAVEGKVGQVFVDSSGQPAYLSFHSSSRLMSLESSGLKELPGQGFLQHKEGFGMPIGSPQEVGQDVGKYTASDWKKSGVSKGKTVRLTYASGVEVNGTIHSFQEDSWGHVKVIKFISGTAEVKFGQQILFNPDWGEYDLLVGTKVTNSIPSPFIP